ncbi:periphilin-1-like [Ranitomeya imitator]|uniref:periphilin-1-like n=1 Tax=Ranitomeya imitator TaxID=111125 RepID=UPI0037E76A0D
MYHRGGDRGWQHGHHQMDVPPSRGHRSRPYRGGYHDHRDHDRYESYHNNACHDRNYNDNQYVDYEERAYSEYERKQSYNEYREHREPVYNRGVRHDGGYHKETYYHDSYQRGHGEPVRYRGSVPEAPHKKYPHKSVKLYKKENDFQMKTTPQQPIEKVNHNPGPIIVTLTPGITEDTSEDKSSKAESPEQNDKPSQNCEKPSKDTTKLESIKKDDFEADSVELLSSPSNQIHETLPASNIETELTECKDSLQTEQSVQEEKQQVSVNLGKRALSEEKDFDFNVDQRKGESFAEKRLCSSHDRDDHFLEKTVQIPLLGDLGDMPSETLETMVPASISDHENTESVVNCELPDAAQELRSAFILARKEQIEVAFAQDCKTFAFVASTLLKKDPSIQAAVRSALHSSLQEMAGLCVQELNNFIDQYDSKV